MNHLSASIFCDESRQDLLVSRNSIGEGNLYSCIGGIMVPDSGKTALKIQINQIRKKYDGFKELKWGTVSPSKLSMYLELIDLFFSTDDFAFRTVVIDARKVDNELYNDSDQELGYYKFYYQLLYHWIYDHTLFQEFEVYTDERTNGTRQRLEKLQEILNNACCGTREVRYVKAIDSSRSPILQLENILMGAVAYKYNYPEGGKSLAKSKVLRRIEKHLGHEICESMRFEHKFNIFKIQLKGGKE